MIGLVYCVSIYIYPRHSMQVAIIDVRTNIILCTKKRINERNDWRTSPNLKGCRSMIVVAHICSLLSLIHLQMNVNL
jgi:hypothetical protein